MNTNNIALVVLRKEQPWGKSSNYPSYSGGSVSVNGNTVASQYKKGNTVYSNYNMTDAEKGRLYPKLI